MRAVSSLLVSLFAAFAFTASAAQAPTAPKFPLPSGVTPDTWITVVQGPNMRFDVLAGSIELDNESFTAQFVMRVILKEPQVRNGKEVKAFAENSLVMCLDDKFISMSQLYYNAKGEHVDTNVKAHVYDNPGQNGHPVTELMRFACGFSPADKVDTPKNKPKWGGDV